MHGGRGGAGGRMWRCQRRREEQQQQQQLGAAAATVTGLGEATWAPGNLLPACLSPSRSPPAATELTTRPPHLVAHTRSPASLCALPHSRASSWPYLGFCELSLRHLAASLSPSCALKEASTSRPGLWVHLCDTCSSVFTCRVLQVTGGVEQACARTREPPLTARCRWP